MKKYYVARMYKTVSPCIIWETDSIQRAQDFADVMSEEGKARGETYEYRVLKCV